MKAIRVNEWAKPVELEDVPQPEAAALGEDEVLVRVHAASLNPVDGAIASGMLASMLTVPMGLGTDLAGQVVAVGSGVTHVAPGDDVYGLIVFRGGAFAEYAVVKGVEIAKKPASLDYTQAAAVPLTALTAWQSLFDAADLKAGEKVLIHGVGGAVGSFAAQFAKNKGAYVIGTGSAVKAEYAKELGVDQFIDYTQQKFEDVIKGVDVVLVTARGDGDLVERSFGVMKQGGRMSTVVGQVSAEEAEKHGVSVFSLFTHASDEQLATIAGLIDSGAVKVLVGKIFPLGQAQQALDLLGSGQQVGKIVLTVA